MDEHTWAALEQEDGRIFLVEIIDKIHKIKGIGVLNPKEALEQVEIGESIQLGHKSFKRLPIGLPLLNNHMK